ncbi:hypothetical protein P167DRAFT_566407 [Morchella conica CCBAS932]|uniref:Uncharacterized protein n=1 Tax=Morchella conica CCBAS932 TaxID=1392247 RepID=A0A3N4KJD7_9PEZI|nr:hypothetical protein P167DRAFT_566407 [Morchella conica CCBAS932]
MCSTARCGARSSPLSGDISEVILSRFAFHPGVILFGLRETPHWERQDPGMFLRLNGFLPHRNLPPKPNLNTPARLTRSNTADPHPPSPPPSTSTVPTNITTPQLRTHPLAATMRHPRGTRTPPCLFSPHHPLPHDPPSHPLPTRVPPLRTNPLPHPPPPQPPHTTSPSRCPSYQSRPGRHHYSGADTATHTILMTDDHPFPIPHNPLQAFHATRAQTIASFRAVAWRDTGFVFGAALPPAAAAGPVVGVPGGLPSVGATIQSAMAMEEDTPPPQVCERVIYDTYSEDEDDEDEAYASPVPAAPPRCRRTGMAVARTASPAHTQPSTGPDRRVAVDATPPVRSTAPAATNDSLTSLALQTRYRQDLPLGDFCDIAHVRRKLRTGGEVHPGVTLARWGLRGDEGGGGGGEV